MQINSDKPSGLQIAFTPGANLAQVADTGSIRLDSSTGALSFENTVTSGTTTGSVKMTGFQRCDLPVCTTDLANSGMNLYRAIFSVTTPGMTSWTWDPTSKAAEPPAPPAPPAPPLDKSSAITSSFAATVCVFAAFLALLM
jgi:hypothetical protein